MHKAVVNLQTNETKEHQQILSIIDNSPMGSKQRWLWFIASGGTLMDGVSVMMIGISLHLLSARLSPVMMGLIGASLVLGAVFGSNILGKVGDSKGRKKLLILNMLIIAVGAFACTFSNSSWILLLGQLIIGIGIGSDFAVSATYIAEISPRKTRSKLMVGTIAFQSIGLLLAGTLAYLVMRFFDSPHIYNYLFAIETGLALLLFFLRFSLSESPRWLMKLGRNREAAIIIAKLFPDRKDELDKLGLAAGTSKHSVIIPLEKEAKTNFMVLFSKEYIKRTILSSVPWFLMDIATYGVGLFTPIILASVMKNIATGNIHIDEINNVIGTTTIDLFLLLGFIIALWLVPKFGRVRMQNIGFGGMFIGMAILFLASVLGVVGREHSIMIFGGFIVFNLFMNAGPNATTFAMAPELFPTQLRCTASGFAAGFAKIGAALGIFVFPIIKNSFGITTVLAGVAVISLLALVITIIYVDEIKKDQSLEQQQSKSIFDSN